MTPGQRAGLWIVLCLVGGAACAFLTLEGIGIPYALVFLGGLIFLSRRFSLLAESLGAFGLTFTLLVLRFVIPNIAYFTEKGDIMSSIALAMVLAVGVGLIAAAVLIRRPNRWFRR